MRTLIYFYLITIILSCAQNEIPIEPHTMGNIESNQINMESDYKNQIYYKLKNNTIAKQNLRTEWDIGFESTQEGWHIILNSAKSMTVSEINNINFEDIISLEELNWKHENPQGINDGTAIGDYRGKNSIYIIDRGFQLDGSSSGYKKLIIDSVNQEFYNIRYANIDNTDSRSIQIQKNNSYHFQYLSFEDDTIIDIEPKKEDWDLLFTQYTHLYEDPTLPSSYLVTGVFNNYLNNVSIAKDTTNLFEDITYNMLDSYLFSNHQNEIGYDWKTYVFNEGYVVNSAITYLIRDSSNRYFKLRFTGFYNSSGEKGYPTFEVQEL